MRHFLRFNLDRRVKLRPKLIGLVDQHSDRCLTIRKMFYLYTFWLNHSNITLVFFLWNTLAKQEYLASLKCMHSWLQWLWLFITSRIFYDKIKLTVVRKRTSKILEPVCFSIHGEGVRWRGQVLTSGVMEPKYLSQAPQLPCTTQSNGINNIYHSKFIQNPHILILKLEEILCKVEFQMYTFSNWNIYFF